MNNKQLLFVFILFNFSFCETKSVKDEQLKASIIALEQSGWEAWRNKDAAWFQKNTTENCIWVNSDGISTKTQMMQATISDCAVKSVKLDQFKYTRLNENTVLLTFIADQDGACGSTQLAKQIRVSVNYVKIGERWLEAFYMETPLAN